VHRYSRTRTKPSAVELPHGADARTAARSRDAADRAPSLA
jgi:hypothetical protein